MAASNRILGEQDVAWVQQEVLAVAGLEVQCAAQRNDELRTGAVCQSSAPPDAVS
jgi:hypothetical protein